MFLPPSHSNLGESLLTTTLLGVYLGEPVGKTPTTGAHRGAIRQQSSADNLMASFNFDFPTINAGTTFVFGSWSCTANGSGSFTSHLIDTTNAKALQQEELGETTSAESFLPQIAEEIERMSLSNTSSTRLPFGLGNSAALYSAIPAEKT